MKLWKKIHEEIDDLLLRPDALVSKAIDILDESIQVGIISPCAIFDDADGFELIQIDLFCFREELFKIFFPGRVALEEITGPLTLLPAGCDGLSGLLFALVDFWAVASGFEEASGDVREGNKVQLGTQLWEKDIP